MSAILAIPLHDRESIRFSTVEKCAEHFKTNYNAIMDCVNKGSILLTKNGKQWVFDEAIGNGERRTFKCVETGEEVSVYGAKEFCEWSGYKSDDILTKGSGRIVNRNDGKTYELVD